MITKELFEQIHVGRVDYKGKWGSKRFAFKGLLTCGSCGAEITAEEKYKLLKDGSYNRHVYYHCTKRKDPNCTEKYVNETDMQQQIKDYVMSHASDIEVSYQIQKAMAHHQRVLLYHLPRYGVMTENIQPLASYADYVLSSSNAKLMTELIEGIQTKFALRNGEVVTA